METLLIIYLIGIAFAIGYWVGTISFAKIPLWWVLVWPAVLVIQFIRIIIEICKLLNPPIWFELMKVLVFNIKIKADEEPLNKYYNKVLKRKKSLRNKLTIKALEKTAKQHNIALKESD